MEIRRLDLSTKNPPHFVCYATPMLPWIIVVVLAVALVMLVVSAFARRKKPVAQDENSLRLLLQQMNELTRTVDAKIGESTKQMGESLRHQFGESQRLVKSINEQVTEQLLNVARGMTEANQTSKQVLNVADQLRNLEKVLKHQKQRGNLGEASLELTLGNMLPPTAYKMQYQFADGDTVDAVVLAKEGMIPIDAKFSLDNYNRVINEEDATRKEELEKEFKNDLKKRIDETAKYIRPNEGTLPLAFMFIPAEGIYYDLLVNEVGSVKVNTRSLIDYAYNEKKVIIVSPTTFAAYLLTVVHGFKAFKIEETAQDIIKRVGDLGRHIAAYEQYMTSLGNALGTTVNHYNKAHKELHKIDKDVLRISGTATGIEPLSLEKPVVEE